MQSRLSERSSLNFLALPGFSGAAMRAAFAWNWWVPYWKAIGGNGRQRTIAAEIANLFGHGCAIQ